VRPPREAYVRATVEIPCALGPVEMISGVEMRNGDVFGVIKKESHWLMQQAWLNIDSGNMTEDVLAAEIERRIVEKWPDRAYFIEVCVGNERDGWVQLWQAPEKP